MLELGALSTDIHDAAAGTEWEQPLFDEPGEEPDRFWRASELTALFNADADIPAIVQAAAEAARLASLPPYSVTYVEEQDWVRLTQSQFDPIKISSRLWIVPSWHRGLTQTAINLILDPGLAFGTGSNIRPRGCALPGLTQTFRRAKMSSIMVVAPEYLLIARLEARGPPCDRCGYRSPGDHGEP